MSKIVSSLHSVKTFNHQSPYYAYICPAEWNNSIHVVRVYKISKAHFYHCYCVDKLCSCVSRGYADYFKDLKLISTKSRPGLRNHGINKPRYILILWPRCGTGGRMG